MSMRGIEVVRGTEARRVWIAADSSREEERQRRKLWPGQARYVSTIEARYDTVACLGTVKVAKLQAMRAMPASQGAVAITVDEAVNSIRATSV